MAIEAFLISVEESKNNQFNHPSLNIMTSYVYVLYLFKVQNYFVTKYTRACRLIRLLLSQRRVFIDREAHNQLNVILGPYCFTGNTFIFPWTKIIKYF